ncbi:hypothetical protein [Mesorhizobium sp. M0715]|uniref:hypothetical protein n=1 Tax=Mesorhizobium sp. M0715 TaxID=2956990 RepID=UPI003335BA57
MPQTARLLRTIILSGWILAGTIALLVIVAIISLAILGKEIPQSLTNYGGVIIGFFFGQFASFMKDALLPEANSTRPAQINAGEGDTS